MLNPVFFLSENKACFDNGMAETSKCRVYLSFLIKNPDKKSLQEAYVFFSANNIPDFSIALQLDSNLNEQTATDIIAFFFNPFYYNVNNEVLIHLLCSDTVLFEAAKKCLAGCAAEQGIEHVNCRHLNLQQPAEAEPGNLPSPVFGVYNNTSRLLDQYRKMLHSEKIYGNVFYVHEEANDIVELNGVLLQAEVEARAHHPGLFKMAYDLQQLSLENSMLKQHHGYMADELNNYKKHVDILRSSHEATILQQYYDAEYESLPLWYKRVGHIIKVFTGKRSFRSLFSNKVKKYTD